MKQATNGSHNGLLFGNKPLSESECDISFIGSLGRHASEIRIIIDLLYFDIFVTFLLYADELVLKSGTPEVAGT